MARPYLNLSGQELLGLFENNGADRKALRALSAELAHRNTPKMRKLRVDVEAALAACAAPASSRPSPAAPAAKPAQAELPLDDTLTIGKRPPAKPSGDETSGGPARMRRREERSGGEEMDELRAGSLGTIRPCGRLSDVPCRWTFPETRDYELEIPPDAPRIVRYAAALRALIKDMRRRGSGMRTLALEGGEAVVLDGRERGYRFPFDGDANLFEGAKVGLVVVGCHAEGRVVAISSRTLTVTVTEDFGPFIAACLLKVDNTAMLEALADRLEKISKGEQPLNLALAEDVLTNAGDERAPGSVAANLPNERESLNGKQRDAVGRVLTNAVTYLWGPPGTGKTSALSVANQLLLEAGKRILICSNTNQAVDQVLLKLCRTLGTRHPTIAEGKAVRIGQIQHEELKNEYSEYVTLDGIVGRKSAELKQRKDALENDIARIRQLTETAHRIVERFRALDEMDRALGDLKARNAAQRAAHSEAADDARAAGAKLAELRRELEDRTNAGTLRRLLLRSEDAIRADTVRAQRQKEEADRREQEQRLALGVFAEPLAKAEADRRDMAAALEIADRAAAQKQVDEADERIHPLSLEVAEINRKLEAMENTVLAEARIVGGTVAKSCLSPQKFANFDIVIIDEASMVMLPAILYVSGLAKEKVIVSGDFRQLSPIIPTEQAAILDEIGADVFHAAGIAEAFEEGRSLKRTAMLEEQHRMSSGICGLISPRMYRNRLSTAEGRKRRTYPVLPPPFDSELVIVDTSPIQPFVNRHGSSRFNLMNALVVRNLSRFFRDAGFATEANRFGICTPFAAQKELLQRVLKGFGLDERHIGAGTVHRYQGDEKIAMVIDIPDSLGERNVGMFAQAEHPDDGGAKLFNVAVSRAKAHLIFIANLDYLDRKLPGNAFLREILHAAQTRGRVVDVRDILAMWPIADDLRRLGRPFSLDPETLRSGLFRETDFDAVCGADIEAATRSVAVFSGFVTPQRVAVYEPLFRRKIAKGVAIRCVTRPPKRNGSIQEDQGREALNALEAMGCVVDTRWDIHEKVVIVDDEIVWFGSLNPLSHTHRTDEMMARFAARPAALQLAAFMAVGGNIRADKAEGVSVTPENPRCPECGSRTTYRSGTHGPYWQCEDACGWTESVGKPRRPAAPKSDLPEKGPSCPECGKPTALRSGQFGDFYGCEQYPACKGIVRATAAKPKTRKTGQPSRKT